MKLLTEIIDVIFPRKCISCGEIINTDKSFCPECAKQIKYINPQKRCIRCGLEKSQCMCSGNVYRFEGVVSVFEHNGAPRQAILNFKGAGKIDYSDFFVSEMVKAFKSELSHIKFDALFAVPPEPGFRKNRKFDHTDILARRFSKITGIPYITGVLKAHRVTKSQHKSNREERKKNALKKYYFKKKIQASVVLLLDDVKTTGSSLDACARQLLFAGADRVFCITALATVRKNDKTTVEKR